MRKREYGSGSIRLIDQRWYVRFRKGRKQIENPIVDINGEIPKSKAQASRIAH